MSLTETASVQTTLSPQEQLDAAIEKITSQESVQKVLEILERSIEGEVRHDKLSKMLYSTDASIYQVEPYGVVLPRHEKDLIKVVQTAAQYNVPVIPRAAGTSLAGQCVGKAIILDISKYMNKAISIDIDSESVWVQPGVIQDELSRMVEADGYHFGPDTSTSNRAMIGGMIGNNSCGAHSIFYGKTVDHTLEMDVILSDGSKVRFSDLTPKQVEEKKQLQTLEGHIYREVTRIAEEYKEDIQEKFPKIMRRNTGYLLDELIREDIPLNLSRIICGSEGTLAMISSAKVRICPRPKYNGLVAVQFESLEEALYATIEAIKFEPSAVELMDRVILDLTHDNIEVKKLRFFLEGDPDSVLAIEFYGDTKEEIEQKMEALEASLREKKLGYTYPRLWDGDINKVWKLRKAGLGILMGMAGDAKPVTFVEDTAVAPEHLPAYIADFKKVMEKYDTHCTYYAHASVGLLHMRPILNLKKAEDIEKMKNIADEIVELVIKYGGSVSGEHGDGRMRSPFHKRFFGERLYQALRELKQAFDPKDIFNPNKIIDSLPLSTDLRYDPKPPPILPTALSFENQGGYFRAAEFCNGAGACRKTELAAGTMCPSYQGTWDETHTTRGRANVLRSALSSLGPNETFRAQEVYDVMELCLECKACKSECPANVDMAKLKYEYLQRRWDLKGVPFYVYAFGHISDMNKFNIHFKSLVNGVCNSNWGKKLIEKFLHIDRRRSIPDLVTPTLRQWFKKRIPHPNAGTLKKRVCLFADTFINYYEPQIGIAAVRVLEAAGYRVLLSPFENDGRPLLSKGFTRKAKKLARKNINQLLPMVYDKIPFIGLEPSSLLTFRDEYIDFFPDDEEVRKIADNCYLIDEFINDQIEKEIFDIPFQTMEKKFLLHGHCFQKALVGNQPTLDMLQRIPGVEAEALNTGCCGMAGSFGYETGKYEVSMRIGEQLLFPAVRNRGEAEVLAQGTSCRHQMHDGAQYHSRHPIEIMAEALPPYSDQKQLTSGEK